ncbi:tetratricopeptide repeat protein [Roseiconus lacunae]|uniref:tetratricopeptide repeat protein n=1 Tax=Roseiconus lacunae TaxID=2605694 RepID=UPI001E64F075|nr:tetratricopeptide repeat protein [Roseiconus lacunae]MCD0458278.1 tetratricopeptide repeat protein [Roseiconus lacunae]
MIKSSNRIGKRLAIVIALTWAIMAGDVNAELLPKTELEGCRMHVVGIYSPENHQTDDRIFVRVEKTEHPIVLVMTGYFGAQWNLDLAEGVDLKQVIIPGYFEHSVVGVPEGVPVEMLTHFPAIPNQRREYFWAYAWHTAEGRELRKRLTELTGLEISTFQGENSASRFVVDGQRGDVGQFNSSATPEKAKTVQETRRIDRAKAMLSHVNEELKKAELQTPSPRVLELLREALQNSKRDLEKLGVDANELVDVDVDLEVDHKHDAGGGNPNLAMIETLVRQSFNLQLKLHEARVRQAEANLKRVKTQLERRQANAEKIIAARIEELLSQADGESRGESDSVAETSQQDSESAVLLAGEGWQAWSRLDHRVALEKFKEALQLDPKLEPALNGLGWTYMHLQKFDQAIAEFKKLLKDAPAHQGAMNGVGQALLAQRKLDAAEEQLLNATVGLIKKYGEPNAVRMGITAAWFGLVRTYLAQEDFKSAKEWADRYLKHKPSDETMRELLEEAKAGLR